MTSPRATRRIAALFAIGGSLAAGCAAEAIGDGDPPPRPDAGAEPSPDPTDGDPGDPGDPREPDDPGEPVDPDDPPDAFDPDDPRSYVWTARSLAFDTLPLLYGTVRVEYAWTETGTHRPLEKGQILVDDLDYGELTDGRLSLRTYRDEDNLPTTYCAVLVEGAAAIASHNAIAEHGYPELDSFDATDPDQVRDEVAETPGVVMMVDGDCTDVDESNPREERSVLSWLAVTFEASPHPDLVDPDDPPDGDGIIGASP